MNEDQVRKLSREERRRWWREAGCGELRQLLFWRWDPIGVNDEFPFTLDEYDTYADSMASLLEQGADAERIAAYLHEAEQEEMELGGGDGPSDRCREVAGLVAAWHGKSISHWLMRQGI